MTLLSPLCGDKAVFYSIFKLNASQFNKFKENLLTELTEKDSVYDIKGVLNSTKYGLFDFRCDGTHIKIRDSPSASTYWLKALKKAMNSYVAKDIITYMQIYPSYPHSVGISKLYFKRIYRRIYYETV